MIPLKTLFIIRETSNTALHWKHVRYININLNDIKWLSLITEKSDGKQQGLGFLAYEVENVRDNWLFIKLIKCVLFIAHFMLGYYEMFDYLFT